MALFSRTGSEDAFAEIVKRFEPQLLRFFKRFRQQDASAADLTQDTFLRVFRARDTYQPGRPLSAWIFAIAQARMHEHHRDETRLCRDNGGAVSLDLAVEEGLAKLSDIIPGDDCVYAIAFRFSVRGWFGDYTADDTNASRREHDGRITVLSSSGRSAVPVSPCRFRWKHRPNRDAVQQCSSQSLAPNQPRR